MESTLTRKLFIGIDVHKRQWSISIFSSAILHRSFSQPPEPRALKSYIDNHFADYKVVCAYKACKFGFWIHIALTAYGYECLVVNPADIPTSNKETAEKTNDSRKIAKAFRGGILRGI